MRLRDKLSKIKEESAQKIPDEAKEIMRHATRSLAESGQVDNVLGTGDKSPQLHSKKPGGEVSENL